MYTNEIYKFFADIIYKKTGMVYADNDYYRLDARLAQLQNYFQLGSGEQLKVLYEKSITNEMQNVLINITTNNETYFFRDVKPFTVLSKKLIPELLTSNPTSLNIWSAACSTGQELFSILMCLKNSCTEADFKRINVEGSDISQQALEKAKKAVYNGLDVQRGLPAPLLVKHFEQLEADQWLIKQDLRDKARFFEFNLLLGSFPQSKYDVIFCRNILIYQNKENKEAIIQKLFNALKPGGYLILGSGESLISLKTDLVQSTFDDFSVYRRNL